MTLVGLVGLTGTRFSTTTELKLILKVHLIIKICK